MSTPDLCDEQLNEALESIVDDLPGSARGVGKLILDKGLDVLTPKQRVVYEKHIKPSLTEKCAFTSCENETLAGVTYCGMHEIEYGS
ncbi:MULTISPECIES: hypothetical protein [Pseudomonas syringae group]|uniref:hypothetical protein n=1 Tax=Pseudomonas syringae group TaxID=136849 RepID=UPI000B0557E7|nr:MULTISPECIES: hypothetical protein [Pseudomonas syringae group]